MSAFEDILDASEKLMDDELKAIFKEVSGVSLEEMKEDSLREMKQEMEEMFSGMGVDINFDGIHEKMTEEEMAQKIKEIEESIQQQQDDMTQKNAARKKTKRQAEQEELERKMEEAKAKNINTIYKQLAKAFHPDLEKDEATKLQKEELMKQLTAAYESNDLHSLLKLEMQWLQKEGNDIDKLSDDKLGIYNEVLKEQVAEAEMELDELIVHPRYANMEHLGYNLWELNRKKLEKTRAELKQIATALEKGEPDLKGPDALMHVKEIIKECQEPDEADAYGLLLQEFLKLQRQSVKRK